MNMQRLGKRHGFTLIELLIVVVVIVILASITVVMYNHAQPAARDTARKADLAAVAEAIQLYRQKYGNDVGVGSGCGSNGNGNGWFNYKYSKSILSCLTDKGYLNGENSKFVDPTGCTTATGGSDAGSPLGYCDAIEGEYYAYMKYTSGSTGVTCLYARLETEDYSEELKSPTNPCASASSSHVADLNMNYELLVK